MITREQFKYRVTLNHTATGQVEEVDYAVYWSPEKVESSEVAVACAAEATKRAGFTEQGMPKDKVLGISAALQKVSESTTKSKKK